jgi:hypothetical protein
VTIIRIAVVDTGVAFSHPHIARGVAGVSLVGPDPADVADRVGHGTAVAAAIAEKAPAAELFAVRVFEQGLATTARLLSGGIETAVAHGCQVINLSVGTSNSAHLPLFEQAVERAAELGVLIVAAAGAEGTLWLPGGLHGVVGVIADPECPRDTVRPVMVGGRLLVAASPQPRPIEGVPAERNLSGVSFAVANTSGLLGRALCDGADLRSVEDVLAWLEDGPHR